MALALLGPILVIFLSIHLKLKIESKLLVSLVRSIVQLLLAGTLYALRVDLKLKYCFWVGYLLLRTIFSMHNPFLVALYLSIMILIAALEATSRQVRTYNGHYFDSLIAVLAGGALVGAYGSVVVFHPEPWSVVCTKYILSQLNDSPCKSRWEPQIMIPTCGMIIGNSISGPAVSVDRWTDSDLIVIFLIIGHFRLLSEVSDKKHESETRLAFGASKYEAVLPVVRASVLAALLPNLNQMAVIGLVSIPGTTSQHNINS